MKNFPKTTIVPLFFVLACFVAFAAAPSTLDPALNRWILAVAGFIMVLFAVYRAGKNN